jgi:Transmembrane amino acid transporter protein
MSVNPSLGIVPPTEQVREMGASVDEIRKAQRDGTHVGIRQRQWGLEARLATGVSFDEYVYWAKVEREMEEEEARRFQAVAPKGFIGSIKGYFTDNPYEDAKVHESRPIEGNDESNNPWSEKKSAIANSDDGAVSPIAPNSTHDLDAEWRTAARAMRNAGWGSIFYLITTDILGWSSCPYVFSNTGYGLGVGIFILMGLAAFVSGIMIWRTFLGLDSSRYPVLSFGDPFHRLYGPNMRHFINFMQSLQMFLSVAVVLLGNTGIIAQLGGSANLCYIVCGVISLVVSMASGYMRSLKHLGWFCNLAVWMNIACFIIM